VATILVVMDEEEVWFVKRGEEVVSKGCKWMHATTRTQWNRWLNFLPFLASLAAGRSLPLLAHHDYNKNGHW
jgi:hypothetical protein